MPFVTLRPFKPCWWLRNAHIQTIAATWFKRASLVAEHTRVELNDGDFIDLLWYGKKHRHQRIVLILHGLEGGECSHYVRSVIYNLRQANYQVVFMYHRGCSQTSNRLAKSYHSGQTDDPESVIRYIENQTKQSVYAIVAYSLGANVLLKYLGEQGDNARIQKAIAISTPFELAAACNKLDQGFSRIYQYHLIKQMRAKLALKRTQIDVPIKTNPANLKTFRDFDQHITAPLNGFKGAHDYYSRSSSRQFISKIRKPCLIIHAKDDPFLPASSIPKPDELPKNVQLQLSAHGGHVGFIEGVIRPKRWLDSTIVAFLK